jgi:uncharacterized membrane protein
MDPQSFLASLDEPRLIAAIQRAECQSTGEIRICVLHRAAPDPIAAAKENAVRLGMQRTRDRNGVLILVAPVSQTFAVVGDSGIHARCGEGFWTDIALGLAAAFADARAADGLESAIDRIAAALAQHFPPAPGDINELPDGIASG